MLNAPEIVLATFVATVPKLVISSNCVLRLAAVLAIIACGVFCAAVSSAVRASCSLNSLCCSVVSAIPSLYAAFCSVNSFICSTSSGVAIFLSFNFANALSFLAISSVNTCKSRALSFVAFVFCTSMSMDSLDMPFSSSLLRSSNKSFSSCCSLTGKIVSILRLIVVMVSSIASLFALRIVSNLSKALISTPCCSTAS